MSCQLRVMRVQLTPRSLMASASWVWVLLETHHEMSVSMPLAAPSALAGTASAKHATSTTRNVRMEAMGGSEGHRSPRFGDRHPAALRRIRLDGCSIPH